MEAELNKQLIEAELAIATRDLADNEAALMEVQNIVDNLRGRVGMLKSLLSVTSTEDSYRTPTDMLRPVYKGMKLGDIIIRVLENQHGPLTSKDITSLIYNTSSQDEFDRARSSVSTELRSGAKGSSPRWQKIGRSAYIALSNQRLSG